MERCKVRLYFAKSGDLRLISHRDLLRTMERLFRRAGVELCLTEGFHPKPKMSFPSALGLGIIGRHEVMEIAIADRSLPLDLVDRLNAVCPPGLKFHSAETIAAEQKSARAQSASYEVILPEPLPETLAFQIQQLLAVKEHLIWRPGRPVPIDLRPLVEELELSGTRLCMKLRITGEAGVRPRDVLEAIGINPPEQEGMLVARTRIELET